MADREKGLEHFDALLCEPALGQPEAGQMVLGLPAAPVLGGAGGRSSLAVLELDWDSQQNKIFEPSISNSTMDNENLLSTVLTYKEADLVPVPITVAPSATEQEVEVIVSEGITRKVRSVNDLILNTGTEEERCTLAKARRKIRRSKVRPTSGDGEHSKAH
ncbi:hypothetical protein V6N11_051906 [Hibiscus sabdariffa]|uniref:Uncharacterized protein n=1 Tax=Hibiscus sabdariffa TaxID=183260 RepID=A0ABR2U8E7_9ROSI